MSPMKSIIRRPSDPLPVGLRKYVSPQGAIIGENAAAIPHVSELISPKL